MSYTFGGATADDIVVTSGLAAGGNGTAALFAGWWYPTTLTATRGYCSSGNVYGMEVDSATDELRFRTDNTTDGQWTTTGADITVNKWWFIAFLSTQNNTGPAAAFRCWVGTAENAPTEVTVTSAVAPIGNFTGNANRFVGNKGTGTLAFQGDVGWMTTIGSSAGGTSGLNIGTAGAIADSEAEITLNKWVIPLWLGRPVLWPTGNSTLLFNAVHFPLGNGGVVYHFSDDPADLNAIEPTINGATFSHNRPPTAPPESWMFQRGLWRAA